MPESKQDSDSNPTQKGLDLSSLSNLSLGPDWGTGDTKKQGNKYASMDIDADSGRHRNRGAPPRRDRRGPPSGSRGGADASADRGFRQERDGSADRSRGRGRGQERDRGQQRGRSDNYAPFRPVVEAQFYPEDNAFKVLTQHLRTSCRTYELFEIARLILEKPERFVAVIKLLPNRDEPEGVFHVSVPDGLPFESEQEALQHVFTQHLDKFFTIEEVEVEPPSGSFQVIHRCGFTGELIAPPNYHRYQALCQQHHAQNLANMSYERFTQRLESIRDEELVKAWLDKMKKQQRFTQIVAEGETPKVLDSLDAARLFLVTQAKDKLIKTAPSLRVGGKEIAGLPESSRIRKSIEFLLGRQQHFPLDTANHLRGRLRRMNFNVYKRGSKGVSYICAVKRRFREPNEVMAENLTDLIGFIEAHPKVKVGDLPLQYLGIQVPSKDEESEGKTLEPSQKESLNALVRDLKYLIQTGYVVEYSDSSLYVPPAKQSPVKSLRSRIRMSLATKIRNRSKLFRTLSKLLCPKSILQRRWRSL
ncbi:MAG: hypothetical protein LR015_11680 [Verrucomicrobia bacterium]|nr:hypothetical protein [Verrucomicrobiota bacterium]